MLCIAAAGPATFLGLFGGGIGYAEVLLFLVLALLIFGGKRLPELGRSLGRGITSFRKGLKDIEGDIERSGDGKSGDGTEPPAPTQG